MRNSSSTSQSFRVRFSRFLARWSEGGLMGCAQRLHDKELFVPYFLLLPALLSSLIPLIFILPYTPRPLFLTMILLGLLTGLFLSYIALRSTDPGYVVTDPFHEDSPLEDRDTLETLHAWALQHKKLVDAREAADAASSNRTEAASVSLASSVSDNTRKEQLAAIVQRMSKASKAGENGVGDLEVATQDLQAFVHGTNQPESGYSLEHLPPPPTRPHFVAQTAARHPVVSYDNDNIDKEKEPTTRLDRAAKRQRKKERKAREERAMYSSRRKDGVFNDAAMSPISEEIKEQMRQESMASATEEEEEGVRSRVQAMNNNGGVMPNPFANADNFFRHDFDAHPIDEREKASLLAASRQQQQVANSNGGASSTNPAPTDAFFIGNPRWHPNKLRDDLDRFAMDRWGLREEFCLDCMIWRPLGSKHCPKSGVCVHQYVSHPSGTGCCIGRTNLRYLFLMQLCMLFFCAIIAWNSVSLFFKGSPFTWSSWRVPVYSGPPPMDTDVTGDDDASVAVRYTWNYVLLIQFLLSGSWSIAFLSTLIYFVFTLLDFIKSANYILLAEGDGLRAEAPKGRMKMNQLQLLMYMDVNVMIKYIMERIILAPGSRFALPCITSSNEGTQYALRKEAHEISKQRRIEWKRLREEAERNAVQPGHQEEKKHQHYDAPDRIESPHHAVEIR